LDGSEKNRLDIIGDWKDLVCYSRCSKWHAFASTHAHSQTVH